jgi:hypothetical protein
MGYAPPRLCLVMGGYDIFLAQWLATPSLHLQAVPSSR